MIEILKETNVRQEQTIKPMQSKFDNLKKNADRNLLAKVEEIKHIEEENSELKTRIKEKNKEHKSLAKERRDLEHHSRKKLREMENKIENLDTFKALKLGEKKSDKKEIKQLQNKP